MKMLFALLAAFFVFGTSPAHAETQNAAPPEHHPFSLEAGAGMNGVLPFFHAKMGWRLPGLDEKLETYLDYSFWNLGQSPAMLQVVLLGGKYYFQPMGQIHPFVGLNAGLTYLVGGPVVGNPGFVDPTSMMGWVLQAGGGIDLMMTDHFGFSGAVYLGYPFWVRPELNLRWAF
ncbi:hypothetical protein COW36_22345 [bacterium (Candidatus Blackallbacteria) CG17_big_fil_post_rev_8_21_14_2_50_48_46]|uniref:Outer membrane protein beta-barrel domain-containing protein n=1 Tax=bacterium (Candidatus Blackallbacteria) CG17_big_fil_post_rev_8_21_14_2_50_48_46 TaxID=2014261 RepID=A0A2M7FYE1_9BACT|nr:MAG: hypothetical protein COW64_13775 [bacterium (Candidatus Blackallbacteria) CG18_big_fil_WC_8_21_14_2_50_49_26]PIW14354.1 MAG: hypothetical protein COW36_22345 [bacterium (Candidatus Blackallbacteria) CG17_big_fil_post_rev_8_21_14_2_50_48_46]PIW45623.1 MAG: hypothetical protein COW20_19950 [bacterium (Candidatus Blackallbacteria) CG13_big_fil_rev_8_21_14_2_50_49_14]